MTTTIQFTPNANTAPPFSTTVILDGATYTLTATWNFYSYRWYYSLTNQAGNLVTSAPLIGSTNTYTIPLAPQLFTSTVLSFIPATQIFVIETS